ncbi:phosphotransferase family protein [Listeria monocytogenes]|nr:phosphotransferase family protein [Listeria monocytogenes]
MKDNFFGREYDIAPAGGETGQAFVATHEDEKFFLTREEMVGPRVAKLLAKIHRSENLQHMLAKIENCYFSADQLLSLVKVNTRANNNLSKEIIEAVHYLEQNLSAAQTNNYVVCHGDVNHNNWIISEENELFLVDWDGAMLADPANDIGMILYQYIPREDWVSWLSNYGTTLTEELHRKLKWYTICQTVMQLTTNQTDEANERAKQIFQNAIEDDEV